MRWIITWAMTAVGLAVISHLGIGIAAQSAPSVIWAALALGLVNVFIRPIVKILTLPINLLTLGLFGLIINAFMLWLVAIIVPGFIVSGFVPAFWGAIILSVISGGLGWIVKKT